jgi:hypothetical protein
MDLHDSSSPDAPISEEEEDDDDYGSSSSKGQAGQSTTTPVTMPPDEVSGDETIQELVALVKQGMPSTFYIVPESGIKDMLLVEFSIFRDAKYEEGNVFVRLFADPGYKRPRILGTHTDGRIMFYLPVPGDILPVLISLCRFIELRFDVESALAGRGWGEKIDTIMLRQYVCFYGLGPPPRLKRIRDEEEAARAEMAKKQRLAEIEVDPRMQLIKQMARAVAKDIKEKHPGWSAFAAEGSLVPTLCCQYVHRYWNNAPANVVTYVVRAPDCPAKPEIKVAYEMGYLVKKEEEVDYFDKTLAGELVLAGAIVPTVDHMMRIKRTSKAVAGFTTTYWPSPGTRLVGNYGDVWQLELLRPSRDTKKKRVRFLG